MGLRRSLRMLLLASLGLTPGCVLCTYEVTFPLEPEPVRGLVDTFAEGNKLDVLIVHGMGLPLSNYADALADEIAGSLELAHVDTKCFSLDRGGFHYGELKKLTFGEDGELIVYSLWWSPTTVWLKQEFLEGTVSEEAVAANAFLKQKLVNDRLSDPVLYAGTYRDAMQVAAEMAIEIILTEQSDADRPLGIITYSLGSKLLFDAARNLQDNAGLRQALSVLAARTHEIYMFANQLPLLTLAEVPPPAEVGVAEAPDEDGLSAFLALRPDPRVARGSGLERLVCVAFSDPNDLLSYPILRTFAERYDEAKVAFVNVEVSVARLAWFFILAEPMKAHSGYDRTGRVMDTVLEGIDD